MFGSSSSSFFFFSVELQAPSSGDPQCPGVGFEEKEEMGGGIVFLIATLGFVLVGFLASLGVRITFNKGPSTNLLHFVLVITAVVCAWMMWAIVYLAQWKPLVNPVLSES